MRFATKAIHVGQEPDPTTGAVVTPIYATSLYRWESVDNPPQYMYSRDQNPTREALEICLASLENARYSLSFASGLAAESAVFSLAKAGEHVLVTSDVYGGTYFICEQIIKPYQVNTEYVDCSDLEAVENALKKKPKLFWLESPTNPLLQVVDLRRLCEMAHRYGVLVTVDNTFASPYFQNPLELGADIVAHSATKYIGGHSDLLGGFAVTNDKAIYRQMSTYRLGGGAVPSAFDCWLMLRGLKSLAARMKEHERNAFAIAQFLKEHPKVERALFPGLPEHPGHEIAKQQMSGFGGMMSIILKGGEAEAKRFCDSVKLFTLGASLGGVESLVSYPPVMSHSFMSAEERQKRGVVDGLVRLSIGIEDSNDLIDDLAQALEQV